MTNVFLCVLRCHFSHFFYQCLAAFGTYEMSVKLLQVWLLAAEGFDFTVTTIGCFFSTFVTNFAFESHIYKGLLVGNGLLFYA